MSSRTTSSEAISKNMDFNWRIDAEIFLVMFKISLCELNYWFDKKLFFCLNNLITKRCKPWQNTSTWHDMASCLLQEIFN
jgi:hypothetical protein